VIKKTVSQIVRHAVDKLHSMGYNTTKFRIDKSEEGVFGETAWHDFTIIEDDAEKPVVFSFLIEDEIESAETKQNGMVLSILDTEDVDKPSYEMDTKEFKSCTNSNEVVDTLVAWYDREYEHKFRNKE